MIHIGEVAASNPEEKKKPLGITPEERHALHLLKTTNIPKTRISKDTGIAYSRLNHLQYHTGIKRPEQVFGLPKHEVPVRQRKPRKTKKHQH